MPREGRAETQAELFTLPERESKRLGVLGIKIKEEALLKQEESRNA